jgi:hypothetical protein
VEWYSTYECVSFGDSSWSCTRDALEEAGDTVLLSVAGLITSSKGLVVSIMDFFFFGATAAFSMMLVLEDKGQDLLNGRETGL